MASAVSLRSYTLAKCTLDSYEAFNMHHKGMTLEDIGARYGLTYEGARYRIKRMQKLFKNGKLNETVRKAQEVVDAYSFSPSTVPVRHVEERLPVRTISGARFSPLY